MNLINLPIPSVGTILRMIRRPYPDQPNPTTFKVFLRDEKPFRKSAMFSKQPYRESITSLQDLQPESAAKL